MNAIEQWMMGAGHDLSPEEIILLKRAKETLERNLAIPGERHKNPLPWHPLRGIRPSSVSYEGIWNWDSAFHALAIARWDPGLAREQIQIFLDAQLESGCLPDVLYMNGKVVTNFGKPPVFPWALMNVNRLDPNPEFVASAYNKYVKYESFWMKERGGDADGLFHYDSIATDPNLHTLETKFESGWDTSVRFDHASHELWPIDLNCYMVMLYRAMIYFADILGKREDVQKWQDRERRLSEKIDAELWNEQMKSYTDRHRLSGDPSDVLSPASFMPLFVGIAGPERAAMMAELASNPEHFHPGMPTVSYSHPAYKPDGYWRGPTWLNTAYFALRGLKDYGFDEIADSGRKHILDWCSINQDGIYEYYDSRSGKGCGANHFGWSAAFIIEFILNWQTSLDKK